MSAAPVRAGAVRRVLQCQAGDDHYCVLASTVQGIQRADQMWRNETGGPVAGYVRDMATEIPVYSLSQLVGKPINASNGGVLIFRDGQTIWGLLIDSIVRTIEVPATLFVNLPPILQSGSLPLFHSAIMREDGLLLYLTPEHLKPALWTDPPAPATPAHHAPRPPAYKVPSILRQQSTQRMLLFTIWDTEGEHLTFGLSISQVMEIMRIPKLQPVPQAPNYLLGLLSWRDRPVPVVDLGAFFRLPGQQHGHSDRLLVARGTTESSIVAIPIQQTVSSVDLPIPHAICRRELTINRNFTRGVFDVEGDTLVIPDFDAIVKQG